MAWRTLSEEDARRIGAELKRWSQRPISATNARALGLCGILIVLVLVAGQHSPKPAAAFRGLAGIFAVMLGSLHFMSLACCAACCERASGGAGRHRCRSRPAPHLRLRHGHDLAAGCLGDPLYRVSLRGSVLPWSASYGAPIYSPAQSSRKPMSLFLDRRPVQAEPFHVDPLGSCEDDGACCRSCRRERDRSFPAPVRGRSL